MDKIASERRKLVEESNLDRKELARRAECSEGTLSDWINNRRPVKKHLHDAIMREVDAARHNSGYEVFDSTSEELRIVKPPDLEDNNPAWKDKALKAEAEVKRLKLINRLLTNEGINSSVLDDLMETLTQADRESLQQSRSKYSRSKAAAPETSGKPDAPTA